MVISLIYKYALKVYISCHCTIKEAASVFKTINVRNIEHLVMLPHGGTSDV